MPRYFYKIYPHLFSTYLILSYPHPTYEGLLYNNGPTYLQDDHSYLLSSNISQPTRYLLTLIQYIPINLQIILSNIYAHPLTKLFYPIYPHLLNIYIPFLYPKYPSPLIKFIYETYHLLLSSFFFYLH